MIGRDSTTPSQQYRTPELPGSQSLKPAVLAPASTAGYAGGRSKRSGRLTQTSGVSPQVRDDEGVGFMGLVGAAELELVAGIAGSMATYCAAGEEASPRDQPALVFTAVEYHFPR